MSKSKKIDKNNIVTLGVVLLLVFIFIGLFWYGLDKVMAMEGQILPPDPGPEAISSAPETPEEAVDYLSRVYDEAENSESKPKVCVSNSFRIDEDSAEIDSNELFSDTFKYVSDNIEDSLENEFEGTETEFGDNFADVVISPDFVVEDVLPYVRYECENCGKISNTQDESCDDCGLDNPLTETYYDQNAACDYIYYKCPSCGDDSNVPLENCEKCGSERPYELKYYDEYTVTLSLDSNVIDNVIKPLTQEELTSVLSKETEGYCNIESVNIFYNYADIVYKVNRETDHLIYIEYKTEMTAVIVLDFIGDYSYLGKVSLKVPVTEYNTFEFTWAGISLDKKSMDIEPGETDNLLATLSCTDPTKPTVKWSSSDESVATVDEDGYVSAVKKASGDVVITASFDFQGVTYTDSCVVHVKYSVESLKLSKKKIKINVGDEYQLDATVSPKNATINSVTWYSEDESVATVDSNGKVTAKKSGTVIIYALSDDRYYKSSCEVIVL